VFLRHGVKVHVYSSGSVQAQKLLFGFSIHGDLNEFFDKHFDIATSGNKKQATSYSKIAMDLGVRPSEIVFCSDDEAELRAARDAGIGNAVMSIRPGNEPVSSLGRKDYTQIFSLLQLCGM
jgi:enolase-phosphatase E1